MISIVLLVPSLSHCYAIAYKTDHKETDDTCFPHLPATFISQNKWVVT